MKENLRRFLWEFRRGEEDVEQEGGVGEGGVEGTDDEASEEVETVFVRSDEDVGCCVGSEGVSEEEEKEGRNRKRDERGKLDSSTLCSFPTLPKNAFPGLSVAPTSLM